MLRQLLQITGIQSDFTIEVIEATEHTEISLSSVTIASERSTTRRKLYLFGCTAQPT